MEKIYVIEKIKRKFMEIAFLLMLFNQKDLTKLFFSHLSIYLLLNSLHLIATKRSEFVMFLFRFHWMLKILILII